MTVAMSGKPLDDEACRFLMETSISAIADYAGGLAASFSSGVAGSDEALLTALQTGYITKIQEFENQQSREVAYLLIQCGKAIATHPYAEACFKRILSDIKHIWKPNSGFETVHFECAIAGAFSRLSAEGANEALRILVNECKVPGPYSVTWDRFEAAVRSSDDSVIPMCAAAYFDKKETCELLMELGHDLNGCEPSPDRLESWTGYLPINYAIENRATTTFRFLVPRAIEVILSVKHTRSAQVAMQDIFKCAVTSCSDQCAAILIKEFGYMPNRLEFEQLIDRGMGHAVTAFLEADIDGLGLRPDEMNKVIRSLPKAAPYMIPLLKDINAADYGHLTPLMEASIRGEMDTVRALLGAGADQDVKDHRGWTALSYATKYKHTQVAGLLRAHKARAKLIKIAGAAPATI